ncbi:hypothetical protein [Lentibacillus sp. Marseille-P4043]|uniref:hypothetical protein n=1 Tax=Lentibacillus sp. Marseille-P4043 TaxID=2040293 RepID=UPI000D0B0AFA|nr:hypothetical protein [Lentibacillus sp. Marseille-P4043]
MKLYFLEPEVSGGHGNKTLYGTDEDVEKKGISGKVKFLHYEFEGWLGDDILESAPAFIITSDLADELKKSELKDYRIEKCLVTTSDEFKELYPNKKIPSFVRFIPLGTVEIEGVQYKNWSGHHFCLSPKGELVLTQNAIDLLKKFSIQNCDVLVLEQS